VHAKTTDIIIATLGLAKWLTLTALTSRWWTISYHAKFGSSVRVDLHSKQIRKYTTRTTFVFCLTGLFLCRLLQVRLDSSKASKGDPLRIAEAGFVQVRCPSYPLPNQQCQSREGVYTDTHVHTHTHTHTHILCITRWMCNQLTEANAPIFLRFWSYDCVDALPGVRRENQNV